MSLAHIVDVPRVVPPAGVVAQASLHGFVSHIDAVLISYTPIPAHLTLHVSTSQMPQSLFPSQVLLQR